jgi:hypothetical protein
MFYIMRLGAMLGDDARIQLDRAMARQERHRQYIMRKKRDAERSRKINRGDLIRYHQSEE